MTRLKDQIRLAKKALKEARKNPNLYSEGELQYMALQLVRAKIALKEKQLRRKQEKGFSNEFSEIGNSNSRRREDDGVRSEGEQPEQPGEP
jgi:hypothetical protein